MQNFIFKNPTEILFGRGMIKEISARVPSNGAVLLAYGGGSIKANGVYDQVKAALSGRQVVEFSGIEANPTYETAMKAVALVKERGVRFLLAVGGGSVIDAVKFIAAAACHPGQDPWEILQTHGANVTGALPLGTVLTLPATGTEANGNSVVSRQASQEKLHFTSNHVFPVFSVLDPETTFSLPAKQVRNGVVDAFAHVMEQYMTYPAAAPLQDRFAEGVLQTLIEIGPLTLKEPRDYEARASFMWSATQALNTLLCCGVPQDWATHMIGHELTAFYGLDHAETLAIIMPGVWQRQLARKQAKLEQYGRRVWQVNDAAVAIERTEAFFNSLGMPTRLGAYQVSANEAAEKVRARMAARGDVFGEHADIGPDAAVEIIRSRA